MHRSQPSVTMTVIVPTGASVSRVRTGIPRGVRLLVRGKGGWLMKRPGPGVYGSPSPGRLRCIGSHPTLVQVEHPRDWNAPSELFTVTVAGPLLTLTARIALASPVVSFNLE